MARGVPALVNPALLTWTRENAGFSVADFAARFKTTEETIRAWEAGHDRPTVGKAREWAKTCGRPLAVLYLPEPPYRFTPLEDYRRLSSPDFRDAQSPWLSRAIRLARDRRELVVDLIEGDDESVVPDWGLSISSRDSEAAGATIRSLMGVNLEEQAAPRTTTETWRFWRELAEGAGALVFQMDRVDIEEVRGFSIYHEQLPVVVVNPNDSNRGRVFTLLHELAHLGLHSGGLCDRSEDQEVEAYCNAVAAAALMPQADFNARTIGMRGDHHWSEQRIIYLSKAFGASKEAAVRRLSTFGYVSQEFYLEKRAAYRRAYQARESKRRGRKEFRIPGEVLSIARNGRVLVGQAFRAYWDGRISIGDLAAVTDVNLRRVEPLREAYLSRG